MNASETAVASPLVSIVIPCCGMLDYTKLCVPSLLKHSRDPFELIFLDIGSLDGTAEYLAGLRDGLHGRVRVEVCRAGTDLDIPEACKEAFHKAQGEFVCLLNNDTVVTPRWLDGLIGMANHAPAHGLVGPMSNRAPLEQLVETVPYRVVGGEGRGARTRLVDVQAVEGFARELFAQKRGKWCEVERLGGFCLLIKRAVLDRIWPKLHEWTDLGLFDTDIVGSKAREAGFSLVRCSDLFVHHFGTRMFAHGAAAG